MSKLDKLKPLADRFACYWCYDWAGGRRFLDGQADSIQEIDPNLYEVKTSTWALNVENAVVELSKEIHRLMEEDLREEVIRGGMGDEAPGEYVNFEQSDYPLFEESKSLLNQVPERVLKDAVKLYFDSKGHISDFFTETDPFAFVLPGVLHPTVKEVLEGLCQEESKKLRDKKLADSELLSSSTSLAKPKRTLESMLELLNSGLPQAEHTVIRKSSSPDPSHTPAHKFFFKRPVELSEPVESTDLPPLKMKGAHFCPPTGQKLIPH